MKIIGFDMKHTARDLFVGLLLALCAVQSFANVEDSYAPESEQVQKVYVTIGILDIDAINSADQSFTLNIIVQFRWFDPALAHDGKSSVRKQLTEIEAPRFLLLNRQRTWSSLLNVVDISPEGEALYRMRLWGDFSQIMRLQEFPFDSHTFEVPVTAIPHGDGKVQLIPDPEQPSFMGEQFSVADWTIESWTAQSRAISFGGGKEVQGFVFAFVAERISGHILIKFIIPLFLIVAMSWVVFWIDPIDGASQLSVSVTSVLTLIAYHIALTSKLPDISYLTRMDLFLFGSTLLVFSSLIEVVLTSRLAKVGRIKLAQRMDAICRIAFPMAYAFIGYLALIAGVGAAM
ncbi:MAG: hypothetical protein V7709_02290 [Halioglobus sp.]